MVVIIFGYLCYALVDAPYKDTGIVSGVLKNISDVVKPVSTTANIGVLESTMLNKTFPDPTTSKNEPTASPQLLKLVKDYREDLWPDKPAPGPEYYKQFQALPGEVLHRAASVSIAWHPVYCRTLGIEWVVEKVISEGNTNVVSLVRDAKTNIRYIHKSYDNPDEFINELHFLTVANHEHIVKPICHQRDDDKEGAFSRGGLLIEYVDGKSAHEYAICCASEEDLKRITVQLIVTMEYINWLGFLHADMKPKNIMVRKDGNIVVIDFGFTTRVEYARKGRGTPATISPEIAYKAPGSPNEGADWWAFAVTIAMIFGARLRALEAADAALRAQNGGQAVANPNEYYPKITAIRARLSGAEIDTSSSENNPESATFQEAEDKEHIRRRHKARRQRKTYVPICLRDEEYERQPTPKNFSPDLRRFLFMFFSLNPEERRFNTTRLQEFIRLHPFLEGTNWSALPSPMSQGELFNARKTFVPVPVVHAREESVEEEESKGDPDYYRYEI